MNKEEDAPRDFGYKGNPTLVSRNISYLMEAIDNGKFTGDELAAALFPLQVKNMI